MKKDRCFLFEIFISLEVKKIYLFIYIISHALINS